jgi:hypothetical protein
MLAAGFMGGYAVPRADPDPHWIAATGAEWRQLSPESRQAYLAGFLNGGAVGQALDAGANDSASLAHSLDSLRRAGFRFPYAVNVYLARTNDFYWWENHRPLPIWHAIWEVNNDLNRLTQHDSR